MIVSYLPLVRPAAPWHVQRTCILRQADANPAAFQGASLCPSMVPKVRLTPHHASAWRPTGMGAIRWRIADQQGLKCSAPDAMRVEGTDSVDQSVIGRERACTQPWGDDVCVCWLAVQRSFPSSPSALALPASFSAGSPACPPGSDLPALVTLPLTPRRIRHQSAPGLQCAQGTGHGEHEESAMQIPRVSGVEISFSWVGLASFGSALIVGRVGGYRDPCIRVLLWTWARSLSHALHLRVESSRVRDMTPI